MAPFDSVWELPATLNAKIARQLARGSKAVPWSAAGAAGCHLQLQQACAILRTLQDSPGKSPQVVALSEDD